MPRRRPPPPKPERRSWHAGTIREVRPGVWRAWRSRERRPDGTSTRPSRTFSTRAAAEAWAANAPLPDQLYLGQWLERWLALVSPTLRPSTRLIYRRHVNACGPLLLRPLADLTTDDWQLQTNALLRRLSPYHVRIWRVTIMTALRAAIPRYLADNPLRRVRLPTPEDAPPKAWRQDEVERLLTAAEGGLHEAWLWTALGTGIRLGEARALRWSDVDMVARTLTIRQSASDATNELGPTKTGRVRVVDLPDEVVPVLVAHRARQAHGEPFVFGRRGGPRRAQSFRVWLRRLCGQADVSVLPSHSTRHSFASLALDAGMPPQDVAHALGHASITTTLKTYAHFISQGQRRVASAVGKRLRRADPGPIRSIGVTDGTRPGALPDRKQV